MQQFQNPNYMMYQQPQYNPYLQRMENLQQFQQAMQQPVQNNPNLSPGLNMLASLVKVVESIDMVKATDIPMDGNMYYFPKADNSEIYGKAWLPNGQTRILTFKPVLDNDPNTLSQNEEKLNFEVLGQVLEGIQSDIKTLTEKLDKISKPTRTKKEVAEDE